MDLKQLIDKRIDDKLGASQGIQRVPAKVLSVTEGYKRADVKLANGAIIKDMLNKTGEELDVGQGVYVEYMTLPSSGYIAMTTGECRPLGGGGEPGTSITIDNAAIITPIQASKFITEEEVIYVDEEELVKIVYGKIPNWCYINGYPARFRKAQAQEAVTAAEVSAVAANDMSLLPSVYEVLTSATAKYKYYIEIASMQLKSVTSSGTTAWYMRYIINVMRTAYTLVSDIWVEGSTTNVFGANNVYIDIPVSFDTYGGVEFANQPYTFGFYPFVNSVRTSGCSINLYPIVILSDTSTGDKSAMLFLRTSAPIVTVTGLFKDDAEKIFALGMTSTTEVIPNE